MDETITPVIVAILGSLQVVLAVYLAKRQNAASAEKDEAQAGQAIATSYASLVGTLEQRIDKLEERCSGYESLIDELERKCAQYEAQLGALDL